MNRRSALKIIAAASLAALFPTLHYIKKISYKVLDLIGLGPIDRLTNNFTTYSGDNPSKSHQVLWDKTSYLKQKGITTLDPQEKVPLVIIGGGISGLSSAYLLKDLKPVILEQAPRFGGNSKGESWQGLDYSIGAAYFIKPDTGSLLDGFIKELGLDKLWKEKTEDDPVVFNGKIYKNFWEGESSPEDAKQFKTLHKHFQDIFEGEVIPFPSLPIEDEKQRSFINELDSLSFKQYCEKIVGEKLHPHIETVLEHYCWSSFGGSFKDISAAQGLNFYAGEMGTVVVLPGGNSKAAEVLLEKLSSHLPSDNFRTNSLVFEVEVLPEGVKVSYDHQGEVKTLLAEQVIMSCPKFVDKKILKDIEPKRLESINQISYNAYLVANVCLNTKIKNDFYDIFLAGNGKAKDYSNISQEVMKQKITDVVYGNYCQENENKTVLSLYRPLPFSGSRGIIYDPSSFETIKKEFIEQINNEILPLFGLNSSVVDNLRIARWGHPLPVASTGKIKDGTTDLLRSSFKDRVHFIEQDNYLLPALETAMTEALLLTPNIRKKLNNT